jgi:hypothetical protein
MKKLLLILLFPSLYNVLIYSQDLIVTNEGDSINCKITKIKADNVYFTFKHKEEIRNTLLPISDIAKYHYNYYQHREVPKEKVVGYEKYQHFRMSLNGGYSYQTARVHESVPVDFKDYIKKMKKGYHFGGDLTYYFTEPLGFGFKYFLFKTSNEMDNIYVEDEDGNRRYGNMSDNLTISFIGPFFSIRFLNRTKQNVLIMNLAIGYMGYSNDKVIVDSYEVTGNSLGFAYEMGYDISLSENISLGFQISCIAGSLYEYKWYDGRITRTIELDKDTYESMNRFDFSIGLRFSK